MTRALTTRLTSAATLLTAMLALWPHAAWASGHALNGAFNDLILFTVVALLVLLSVMGAIVYLVVTAVRTRRQRPVPMHRE